MRTTLRPACAALGMVAILSVAALTPTAAAPDTGFDTQLGTGFTGGDVGAVAVQPDGKVLVGGSFTSLNGTPTPTGLIRLNADGTRDDAFNSNLGTGLDGGVGDIVVQPDGKILIGGFFSKISNGDVPDAFMRLNANGTRDTVFNSALGTGFSGGLFPYTSAITLQPDGKILVGGLFTTFNSLITTPDNLVRLNSNGSWDQPFNNALGTGFNDNVIDVRVRPDGRILVGGEFTRLSGQDEGVPDRLAQLTVDGFLDAEFAANLGTGFSGGVGSSVAAVTTQGDGSILAGGNFTTLNGIASRPDRLVRLRPDGSPDTAFNAALGTGVGGQVVDSLAVHPNGLILVGGEFNALNGDTSTPNQLMALNADGSPNAGFNATLGTGFNTPVYDLGIRADGRILVGGTFTTLGGDGAIPDRLVGLLAPPSPPRSVAATGAKASATVTWQAPLRPGGPITGYRATASAAGQTTRTCTTTGATTKKCTITGLTNGVTYSVRVTARNASGSGLPSASVAVIPRTPLSVTWSVSGRTATAKLTAVAGAAFYSMTSTGATQKSVACSRVGTSSPARFSCTMALQPGTSTLRVRGIAVTGLVTAISAPAPQTVS